MTTFMERGIEDRLQNLEHGLLNPSIYDVRDSKPPLTAAGFGNPNSTNSSREISLRQQGFAKLGQHRPGMSYDVPNRLAIFSRRTFVARNVK